MLYQTCFDVFGFPDINRIFVLIFSFTKEKINTWPSEILATASSDLRPRNFNGLSTPIPQLSQH